MTAKAQQQPQTYRTRVLAVIASSSHPLTGNEIAVAANLDYKQTIDALNALYNYGRVNRTGRKFMARWRRVPPPAPVGQLHPLDLAFFRMKACKK
jgi:hypothetical protein